jgi:hypothetical protein
MLHLRWMPIWNSLVARFACALVCVSLCRDHPMGTALSRLYRLIDLKGALKSVVKDRAVSVGDLNGLNASPSAG